MKRLPHQVLAGEASAADPTHFTGPVRQLLVHAQPESHSARTLVVAFEEGARTHWHSHAGGQVLHVLSGRGQAQSRGGEVIELGAGDVVVAEPGEEHWHGAAPGDSMRHLAISLGDVRWGEPA